LLHQMIMEDILYGQGVGLIDPHGDLYKAILQEGIPDKQEGIPDKLVVLFDVTDTEYPVGLNLLAVPPGVPPDRVADQALSIIRKMFIDDWPPGQMETVLDAALRALVRFPGAIIIDVIELLTNPAFRSQVLENVDDPISWQFWNFFNSRSENEQRRMAQPIINRISRFYRNPTLRRIICQEKCLDFRKLLDMKAIFLANLGGLTDIETEILGSILVSKIQLAAMSRGDVEVEKRTPHYLYIDEVQRFTTTPLPELFSEARKFGLSLTVANQRLGQLKGDTLEAVMGSVGTSIMFVVDDHDAGLLARYTRPQFTADDLVNLNLYNTVVDRHFLLLI